MSVADCPGSLRWDGSPLAGRTILLHAEGGWGDGMMFIRYAPLVKRCGGRVIVQCGKPLFQLLSTCAGIDEMVMEGNSLPHYDFQVALASLPSIFRTTLETVPADVPYLHPDKEMTRWWGGELRKACQHEPRELKIGIAWQGNPRHEKDFQRSISLQSFAPLARVTGVRLFSLQKGPGAAQLADVSWPLIDLGSRFETWMDTAAAMANLDLVIAVDTAPAHCAGALGLPVWMLLAPVPEWRWLLEREDSPWYPTMRLFRQKRLGDWTEVFERATEEVRKLPFRNFSSISTGKP